jgi:hypothetical protein
MHAPFKAFAKWTRAFGNSPWLLVPAIESPVDEPIGHPAPQVDPIGIARDEFRLAANSPARREPGADWLV